MSVYPRKYVELQGNEGFQELTKPIIFNMKSNNIRKWEYKIDVTLQIRWSFKNITSILYDINQLFSTFNIIVLIYSSSDFKNIRFIYLLTKYKSMQMYNVIFAFIEYNVSFESHNIKEN